MNMGAQGAAFRRVVPPEGVLQVFAPHEAGRNAHQFIKNAKTRGAQAQAAALPLGPEKWVHFFGPVNGKTKVDSFIGYAAHLGLIRGGTPSGLYC